MRPDAANSICSLSTGYDAMRFSKYALQMSLTNPDHFLLVVSDTGGSMQHRT
jgi:hypothetical protein